MRVRIALVLVVVLTVFALISSAQARPTAAKNHKKKGLFDLPAGYYLAAGGICIAIGAAGGVAYAGIMGPKRKVEGLSSENP